MLLRQALGDIGHVEYDMGPDSFVRIGDRMVPREVSVVFPSDKTSPALTMRLAVVDGVPQCRELHIDSKGDGREVRTSDLRAVTLESWIADVYAVTAMRITETEKGSTTAVMDASEDRAREAAKVIERARAAARRTITPEHLREVARIYKAHIDDRPTQAVARTFGVEHTTAAKYVQRARADGFLPKTSAGKKMG